MQDYGNRIPKNPLKDMDNTMRALSKTRDRVYSPLREHQKRITEGSSAAEENRQFLKELAQRKKKKKK